MNVDHTGQSVITVVVVNDNPVQLGILAGLLANEELDVRTFDNAAEALLEMGKSSPPHLIITDLYMPDIDGWRFCRLLRSPEYKVFNQVPILVVSATFSGDEASRITADLGANAFLSAPVDGGKYIEKVQALLQGEQPIDQPSVLIVEDSKTLVSILKKAFEAQAYYVNIAFSVQEAADIFSEVSFDLCIIDYHLPDGKGDLLLAGFQNDQPNCVCIMMSTDHDPELSLAWMRQGAAANLHKPFVPEFLVELCAKIRRERALLRVEDLLEERTRQLRESEDRYRLLFESAPDSVFVVDTKGIIIEVNPSGEQLYGYPKEGLIGKPIIDLIHSSSIAVFLEKTLELQQLESIEEEIQIVTSADNIVTVWRKGLPLTTAGGCFNGALIYDRDITGRKEAEEAIKVNLKEKETLLKEVHHRVKNNLQIVVSLLSMQSDQTKLKEVELALQETLSRVRTIATVHEYMYRSNSLATVAAKEYISTIVMSLISAAQSEGHQVHLEMDFDNLPLTLDTALPFGLIANELMTNSLKYAFKNSRSSQDNIYIEFKRESNRLNEKSENVLVRFTFSDNGIGLPVNFDIYKQDSLGMELIIGLTRQLKGKLNLLEMDGTGFRIEFPLKLAASAVEA
ncbi:response regulator [bacterium]|nr:response regulator [bacterium]